MFDLKDIFVYFRMMNNFGIALGQQAIEQTKPIENHWYNIYHYATRET